MRGKSTGKPRRLMLALMCIWVAGMAVVGLFIGNILGSFLFFTGGWANGWPFGLSSRTVVSVAATGYYLLLLMTAAAGIGAIVGLLCTLLGIRWEHVGRGYKPWFWFAVVFLCLSAGLFLYIYVYI
jgi:hypothetical protein